MIKHAICAFALLIGTAASAQTRDDYVEIPGPSQNGAIALPTVPADTIDKEQWWAQDNVVRLRNVTVPTLTPVLPAGTSTGAAVIVAPGGGFLGLAIDHEGWQVARWLANHGIAAFLLKYRVLPTPADNERYNRENEAMRTGGKASFAPPSDTPPEALADGLAALRYLREHSADYEIDPHRVGFLGFSAGGFLSRSVVEHGGTYAPDFVAPIYPSMAPMQVPTNAPPMFVAIAADDFLLKMNPDMPLLHDYRAASGSIEFHLLANGGHGFGLAKGTEGMASEDWIESLYRWMGVVGVLGTAE